MDTKVTLIARILRGDEEIVNYQFFEFVIRPEDLSPQGQAALKALEEELVCKLT